MSDTEDAPTSQPEAQLAMEEAKARKAERLEQEKKEYEENRKEEKAKEEEEIRQLREKREQRKVERAEEEKRVNQLRIEENARRQQEERERQQRKLEEEDKRKEEKDRRRKEQEERMKLVKKPNYVITKRGDGGVSDDENEQKQEEIQKSKEQLEEEKRAILAQRIQALDIDGMKTDGLKEKTKELHEKLHKLMGEQYDQEQKFKRQQYDMIELSERARQMNKGGKNRSSMGVKVDDSFDRLADKFINAPPKIQLCSKYERHTDSRSYGDRISLFEDICKPITGPEIVRKKTAQTEAEGEEEEE